MKTNIELDIGWNDTIHLLPRWVSLSRGEPIENVAFMSGSALATLDMVLRNRNGTLPEALIRDRLALTASKACLKLEGRHDSTSDIRDAVCLARLNEPTGPGGAMFLAWRKTARLNLSLPGWRTRLTSIVPEQIVTAVPDDQTQSVSPVGQAAQILAAVLTRYPRQEAAALMLADASLARAIGWSRPMPLLASHMKRRDLRAIADGTEDPVVCIHRALIPACDATVRLAADLERRSQNLRGIASKLRAKGSAQALELFLTTDAVLPSGMLSPVIRGSQITMTGRAARRLCDRLVDLGVVRELTGRSAFRLYGL